MSRVHAMIKSLILIKLVTFVAYIVTKRINSRLPPEE